MTWKLASQGEYNGFNWFIAECSRGFRCGYVFIPEGHPLFGKTCRDKLDVDIEIINNQPIGKRGIFDLALYDGETVTIGILFDVHGGITYSGGKITCQPEGFDGYWVIGFDCDHAWDRKDESIMDEDGLKNHQKYGYDSEDSIVRTAEYVESECKSLIDQVIKYTPLLKNL